MDPSSPSGGDVLKSWDETEKSAKKRKIGWRAINDAEELNLLC